MVLFKHSCWGQVSTELSSYRTWLGMSFFFPWHLQNWTPSTIRSVRCPTGVAPFSQVATLPIVGRKHNYWIKLWISLNFHSRWCIQTIWVWVFPFLCQSGANTFLPKLVPWIYLSLIAVLGPISTLPSKNILGLAGVIIAGASSPTVTCSRLPFFKIPKWWYCFQKMNYCKLGEYFLEND